MPPTLCLSSKGHLKFETSSYTTHHPLSVIIFCNQDNILIAKYHYDPLKGHNSTKGENPDLKKNICQLFFDEGSIYEISKLYLNKF